MKPAAGIALLAAVLASTVRADGLDLPSGTYSVDPTHSYVTFSYLHQGLSHPLLRAVQVDGELELDAEDLTQSSVAIAVAADSIRSNLDYFDRELASPKFFNAAKYAHITYVADRLAMKTETEGVLEGAITIRGISRPLALDVVINAAMTHPLLGKPVLGASASGELRRAEFGLDRFIPAVSDVVELEIEVEFVQGSDEGSAGAAALARAAQDGGGG